MKFNQSSAARSHTFSSALETKMKDKAPDLKAARSTTIADHISTNTQPRASKMSEKQQNEDERSTLTFDARRFTEGRTSVFGELANRLRKNQHP